MSFGITDFLFGDKGYLEVYENFGVVLVFAKGCGYWGKTISGAMVGEVGERGSFWCGYWDLGVGFLRWCVGELAYIQFGLKPGFFVFNTPRKPEK